jgi:hypothetical protein
MLPSCGAAAVLPMQRKLNLDTLHASFPPTSWYKVPRIWREHRDHIVACSGRFVVAGYGEIARQWLIRPSFIPVPGCEEGNYSAG